MAEETGAHVKTIEEKALKEMVEQEMLKADLEVRVYVCVCMPFLRIPYMSWLILIMLLSTSMLNCAISFGKRRAGELFHSNRSA